MAMANSFEGKHFFRSIAVTSLPQTTCSSVYLIDKFSSASTLVTHLFVFIRQSCRLGRRVISLSTPAYYGLNCPSSTPLSTSISATRLPPILLSPCSCSQKFSSLFRIYVIIALGTGIELTLFKSLSCRYDFLIRLQLSSSFFFPSILPTLPVSLTTLQLLYRRTGHTMYEILHGRRFDDAFKTSNQFHYTRQANGLRTPLHVSANLRKFTIALINYQSVKFQLRHYHHIVSSGEETRYPQTRSRNVSSA